MASCVICTSGIRGAVHTAIRLKGRLVSALWLKLHMVSLSRYTPTQTQLHQHSILTLSSIQDMIYSSVKTHLATSLNELYPSSVNLTNLGSPSTDDDLWSIRSAGTFSIPVCISTHNWMAPVEPVFDITCDTNPHCRKKYLPCNCGLWGKDTEQLWKETGLWTHKHAHGEYKKLLCPRQIEEKIKDPLERFVAYCRLGVRKTGLGGIIKRTGKHPLCDTIIEAIETQRDPSLGTISRDLRTRLECAAGVMTEKHCRAVKIISD